MRSFYDVAEITKDEGVDKSVGLVFPYMRNKVKWVKKINSHRVRGRRADESQGVML